MNNHELDQLLKSVPPPGRPADYWNDFPAAVRSQLTSQPASDPVSEPPRPRRLPAYGWAVALGAACIMLGFVLGFWRGHNSPPLDPQFAAAQKLYRESEGLFRHQIRAIIFENGGPRLILADHPNVPDSPPYYLKVCGPSGCQSFITFSGQQIQVNGRTCDVLADGSGRVMLVNDHAVWAQDDPSGPVRVAARRMSTQL